jgi:hypothetical protein
MMVVRVAVVVLVAMVVGGRNHPGMLFYNITEVHHPLTAKTKTRDKTEAQKRKRQTGACRPVLPLCQRVRRTGGAITACSGKP